MMINFLSLQFVIDGKMYNECVFIVRSDCVLLFGDFEMASLSVNSVK